MPSTVRYVTLFLLGFAGMIVCHVMILTIIGLGESVKLKVPFYPIAYLTVFPALVWFWSRRYPEDRIAAPLLILFMPFAYWFGLLWGHVRVDFTNISVYSSTVMILVLPATLAATWFASVYSARRELRRRAQEDAHERA